MEIQLLQAVGRIASIGGLALGAFVLLFEEVIDHASGLIRQFMYLTFGIAVCGIAPAARVDVTGTWSAPVKYSWGDTHPETFQFERYQEKHRYRGTVSADGEAIELVLDTDSGYDALPPATFTAHRSAAK